MMEHFKEAVHEVLGCLFLREQTNNSTIIREKREFYTM